jgi:hypothetical protein
MGRVLALEPGNHLVVALAEHCPQLIHVDFSFCNQLTDTSVVALAEHCPQLTNVYSLQLLQPADRHDYQRGRAGRALPAADQRRLLRLQPADRHERGRPALAEHCSLTNVNFYDCNQLTDTSGVALAEQVH